MHHLAAVASLALVLRGLGPVVLPEHRRAARGAVASATNGTRVADDVVAWERHATHPEEPTLSCYLRPDGAWMCAPDGMPDDADASF